MARNHYKGAATRRIGQLGHNPLLLTTLIMVRVEQSIRYVYLPAQTITVKQNNRDIALVKIIRDVFLVVH